MDIIITKYWISHYQARTPGFSPTSGGEGRAWRPSGRVEIQGQVGTWPKCRRSLTGSPRWPGKISPYSMDYPLVYKHSY